MNLCTSNEFIKRSIASIVAITLCIVILWVSTFPSFTLLFVAVIAIIAITALSEYFKILENKGIKAIKVVGMVCIILLVVSAFLSILYPFQQELSWILIFICSLLSLLKFFKGGEQPIVSSAATMLGVVYVGTPLALIVKVRYFFAVEGDIGANLQGIWWIVYLVATTKVTDIGGYIVGKKWGYKKLAPHISPNKTINGALGGLLCSICISFVMYKLQFIYPSFSSGITLVQSIYLAFILSVFAQVGDLLESVIKRDGEVKDSSSLPGLGGVLDMFDSLLLTTPIVYLYLRLRG